MEIRRTWAAIGLLVAATLARTARHTMCKKEIMGLLNIGGAIATGHV